MINKKDKLGRDIALLLIVKLLLLFSIWFLFFSNEETVTTQTVKEHFLGVLANSKKMISNKH